MKRVWNSLLIALCFLLPLSASITLAQSKPSTPAVENSTPSVVVPTQKVETSTPEVTPSPSSAEPAEEAKPEATEQPETKPDSAEEATAEEKEPEPTPEEIAQQQKLIEADQLYMGGQYAAAEKLYREVKPPFPEAQETSERKEAMTDPQQLPPAGKVYWREAQAGIQQNLETKILVPLQFLVEQYPEFTPGYVQYAQALDKYGKPEEALQILEKATTLYPADADLLKAKVEAYKKQEQWLEASLAARQFSLLNPTHSQSAEFATVAEENLQRYKKRLKAQLRGNAIANVITGTLGYVLTGNLFGPISAIETTALMLRGESAVGAKIAERVQKKIPMVEDEAVLNYVRDIGNKLTTVAGRNDFQYEFHVIMDDKLNAFALPGGKVFVNAGAISKVDSEAELAGLLAHELSHAVLSHGFQLVTEGNLTANVTQFVPLGGTLANLIVLDYSRDMERQADILGTRILTATGYAADGMHNLMVELNEQEKEKDRPPFPWLSTHPITKERVRYLEQLIQRNGYNRYAYEGVAKHLEMKAKTKQLLVEHKRREEEEKKKKSD